MKRRLPRWVVPGWETVIAIVGFAGLDCLGRFVLTPWGHRILPLPPGFWTPSWWAATFLLMGVVDATSGVYGVARARIGAEGADLGKARDTLDRLPYGIWPAVAGVAAAMFVQWLLSGRVW